MLLPNPAALAAAALAWLSPPDSTPGVQAQPSLEALAFVLALQRCATLAAATAAHALPASPEVVDGHETLLIDAEIGRLLRELLLRRLPPLGATVSQ